MTPGSESLSPGQHNKFDLQVFNLEFVRQLESSEEPGPQCIPDPLPPVPLAKVSSKAVLSWFTTSASILARVGNTVT